MSGGPRVVWMPGGIETEIHLGAEETAGAFCLLVDHPPAGWRLPAHRHRNEAETIHVIDGEFEMDIGGVHCRLMAGQSVHVPRDVVHSGGNVGSHRGRRVVLFSPAGLERFFLEAGTPRPEEEPDLRAALASAERHGWQFVGGM